MGEGVGRVRPRVGGLSRAGRGLTRHTRHTHAVTHAPNHGGRATGRAPSGADTKIAVAPVSGVTTFALHSRTTTQIPRQGARRRKKCARRAREKTHHCKSYVRVHISVVQPGGESGRSRIRSRAEPLRPCMQAEEFAHACPGGPAVQLAGVRCERPTPRKSEEAARMAVGSPSGSTCPHETSVRIVSCHCEER